MSTINLIKPDWNIFRAKFSGHESNEFEWLCYLMFCKEYNKPTGLFRYKNQSGIETNPIKNKDNTIGWQAKFYDTPISRHKQDLLAMIDTCKSNYPNITKLLVYSNLDWGQGRNNEEPKAKTEVEALANKNSIEIEWRTQSFFESPFVTEQNSEIIKHFFTLETSLIDMINQKKTHTEILLSEIKTKIIFGNSEIEIDRSTIQQQIISDLKTKKAIIVGGEGGVGKTAVIKNIYKNIKDKCPFYIFKATEFNLNNINELFANVDIDSFLKSHKNEKMKIIVIDSAEALLQIKNKEPFKELIILLKKYNWNIIFTSRTHYSQDLVFQLSEIYNIVPSELYIQKLSEEQLKELSHKYGFLLPNDSNLRELIKNPFYLNEYLKFYKKEELLDYKAFKDTLWNNIIKKAKPLREQCFLKIAFKKANENLFYILNERESDIFDEFVQDGILGYETSGYFITQDIYEEWALEKIIGSRFTTKNSNNDFFETIGESLLIRRSFRNWLSEQLLLNNNAIGSFIEEVILDKKIEPYWKDEVLVSVLLSEYSDTFFQLLSDELLSESQIMLKRLCFLLRIACKDIDYSFFEKLRLKDSEISNFEYIPTKPNGKGWNNIINFFYENIYNIGIENYGYIMPILNEWNYSCKTGKTTKQSSLLALKFYYWFTEKDAYFSDEEYKKNIINTIFNGAFEIKEELKNLFEKILHNNDFTYRNKYYDIVEEILGSLYTNGEVLKELPKYALQLADKFWTEQKSEENDIFGSRGDRNEFGICDNFRYYPASAFQTPIIQLLIFDFKSTIDFIINFTNNAVEYYFNFDKHYEYVEEIEVVLDDGESIKQYISGKIWGIYRGANTSPDVLQSIHMALERFFLKNLSDAKPEVLESWLLYLLRNTKSASITAVIVSIVLAFPNKTFNVAKILFKTKEFFLYDKLRLHFDTVQAKMLYGIGYGINRRKLYQNERLETCDDPHRKDDLEGLALKYQLFRTKEVGEEESIQRQKIIWDILDEHYKNLKKLKTENEQINTWKLALARMDKRKMEIKTEQKDNGIEISFEPKIDNNLKDYIEKSQKNNEYYYTDLAFFNWIEGKIRKKVDDRIDEYDTNEKIINKIKEIVKKLNNSNDEKYHLLNHAIPAKCCSILVRDYFDELTNTQQTFCKKVILASSSSFLNNGYDYQMGDGVEEALFVLPKLISRFSNDAYEIKKIIMLALLNNMVIGAYSSLSNYVIKGIHEYLWNDNFDDAQSLFSGFLYLELEYQKLKDTFRRKRENYSEAELLKELYNTHISDFSLICKNETNYNIDSCIELANHNSLLKALTILPDKNIKEENRKNISKIINAFINTIIIEGRMSAELSINSIDFYIKLSKILLTSEKNDINIYLKIFIEEFDSIQDIEELFEQLIIAEDELKTYNTFWYIWQRFYPSIVNYCKNTVGHYDKNKVLKSYLFASTHWRANIKQWVNLKDKDRLFFKKISEDLGDNTAVLLSITKLLHNIGSDYLQDGIRWISKMLKANKNLWTDELEKNTIYYLEIIIRKYIYIHRETIRKKTQLKNEIIVVLNFLIEKNSVVGYMLRENIL